MSGRFHGQNGFAWKDGFSFLYRIDVARKAHVFEIVEEIFAE